MTRKPMPKNLRRNCDDRMRKYITARAQCERCGTPFGPFECAHIIRRRYSWTRTDERNAWCLCRKCHEVVDTYTSEMWSLIGVTIGRGVFAELENKSKCRLKFDWAAELERWKGLT